MTPNSGSLFHFSRRSQSLRRRPLVLVGAILAGWAVFAINATAQQSKPQEYQVKAVYLFNFGKFINWPATTKDESFAICVLGIDPFGAVLDETLAGEAIDNQKLVARRITNVRQAANCRILYISLSESIHIREILASLEKTSVLTVSDISGFTGNGGMVQFVLRENKVRFEVNLTAAEKAGLILNSQLLKVATDIKKESPGEGVKR